MARGDLHQGSWAGLQVTFLGTANITSNSGVSWPLVLSHGEGREVLRAAQFGAMVLGWD